MVKKTIKKKQTYKKKVRKSYRKKTKAVKKVVKEVKKPEIKKIEVVYLGMADEAERIGVVTGKRYQFYKNEYGQPKPTEIDEQDYSALVAEKGKGCARRKPEALFMSKTHWDIEIQLAKSVNR